MNGTRKTRIQTQFHFTDHRGNFCVQILVLSIYYTDCESLAPNVPLVTCAGHKVYV